MSDAAEVLRASWRALPVNEQRMAVALAGRPLALHEQRMLARVGMKTGSVARAVEGLLGRGDAIPAEGDLRC